MPVERNTSALHAQCIYLPDRPILTAAETARLMGFPTQDALGKARLKGRLGIPMFRIQGRRGWYASTEAVRQWLEASMANAQYLGSKEKEP